MPVKRITPLEAQALLDAGYTYLDVRSIPEYEQGHPGGAHNAPLMHFGAAGMTPNPEFVVVVSRAYPKDTKLVVGCKSGGRSQRAAMMLEMAGFTNLVEMKGGFGGEADMSGRIVEKGWASQGLPVATEPSAGGTWEELKRR